MAAGIYIHIPFCVAKCPYCDFYSIVSTPAVHQQFMASMKREIALQAATSWVDAAFDTIYFGGGTPSLLKIAGLGQITAELHKNFNITGNAEVTVEVNPDTVDGDFFKKLPGIGVNRVSIGIQSFNDNELLTLGRIHDARTSLRAIEAVKKSEIRNLSLDLIFGIPGQDEKSWQRTLSLAVKQNPDHISAYGLTIEKGTPLETLIKSRELAAVSDDVQAKMYRALLQAMAGSGFDRYEISNFAHPGFESRHNLKYWEGEKYLGLGPAAHSFDGQLRSANFRDLEKYTRMLDKNHLPVAFSEKLTDYQKKQERLLLGLRLASGVPLAEVETVINKTAMATLISSGHIFINDDRVLLSEKGLLVADEVITRLIKN
jgi:oxygen-independent coproporphyrinogen-3 oxidase